MTSEAAAPEPTYLLDTNAFSDLMRERPAAQAKVAALRDTARLLTCPVVRGEVLHGIQRLAPGKRRDTLQAKEVEISATILCVPMPPEAGDHYASVKVARQRAGLPLDENDLWIAASALALGAVLVTRDDHFERIDGLVTEDWSR